MFVNFNEFLDRHATIVARAYEQSDAARWTLPFNDFARALHVSICSSVDPPAVAIASLRLSDLALAAACGAGIAAAWEEFVRRYRPILYTAARAIADDEFLARELADSLYADLYGMEDREGERRSLLDHFHGRSSLATWLRAVLAQRHVDYVRESRRGEALANRGGHADPTAAESIDSEQERYMRPRRGPGERAERPRCA